MIFKVLFVGRVQNHSRRPWESLEWERREDIYLQPWGRKGGGGLSEDRGRNHWEI